MLTQRIGAAGILSPKNWSIVQGSAKSVLPKSIRPSLQSRILIPYRPNITPQSGLVCHSTTYLKNLQVKKELQYSSLNHIMRSYTTESPSGADLATVYWILKDGTKKAVTEKVGMNLLEIAHKHGIDLEGACDGSLACSTCHVIVDDPDIYEITGEITDEENDMLDLAFGLTQTSRLGCQVVLSQDLDGMVVRLPSATRNMMVDGHVPKPH